MKLATLGNVNGEGESRQSSPTLQSMEFKAGKKKFKRPRSHLQGKWHVSYSILHLLEGLRKMSIFIDYIISQKSKTDLEYPQLKYGYETVNG